MPRSISHHDSEPDGLPRRVLAALAAAVFLGPVAWLVALQAAYALSYAPCLGMSLAATYVSLGLTFAAALLGAAIGWWARRRTGSAGWAHWTAITGMVLSLWFAFAIAISAVPSVILEPCR